MYVCVSVVFMYVSGKCMYPPPPTPQKWIQTHYILWTPTNPQKTTFFSEKIAPTPPAAQDETRGAHIFRVPQPLPMGSEFESIFVGQGGGGYIHLPDTYMHTTLTHIHIPSPLNSTSQTTFFKKFNFFKKYFFFSCCFLCIFFNCSKTILFCIFFTQDPVPTTVLGLVNSIQPDATIE